jgi:hypothetical protein
MDIRQFRTLHRKAAPLVLLPLTVTVFTGVFYRLGKSWLGLNRDQLHFLMKGNIWGQPLSRFMYS